MSERNALEFPAILPISARVADIAEAIDGHQVVIVAGATGSGKTTQLPKIALAMGRGLEKIIGVTQPRRIAATSVAARVATELGSPLGTDVGYQIRFEDRTSPSTYVKFMTDGILLAEIQGDRLLRKYDTLVIDEAHERSLTIDFLLGWLRRILPERPDLKVIVSSATIETDRFSEFFGGPSRAPVIEVEGRTFPVDVLYEPPADDDDLPEAVATAVANVTALDPRGDILVFLPGEREIRDAENALAARRLRHTVVQPLYARLSAGEQARVFSSIPERRVILATNVAETSVTIPGIVYVVDTGVARLSRYDPRSGTTRLQIEGISQASADQRKGRCGRVRDGICVRLYDEASFAARPAYTDPEIKRTGLAGVILRMKSLGLGDVEEFPFLDPPQGKAITEGYRVLEELGALDEERRLTPLGTQLARFPVDPRIGRMILAGAENGSLRQVLVIAAALNIQDPRERPQAAQQKADDLHRRFRDERSDFVGLLRLWEFVQDAERKGTSNLRRVCRDNFLSFLRVREWNEVHRQLQDIVKDLKLTAPEKSGDDLLHRALLTGLLSKIGNYRAEQRNYVGAKQTRFMIHPSSGVAKKPPAWLMAFELVETSQLFARMVAKIDPEWLMEAGAHVLKHSYSEPHWSEASARASIKQHTTLFGLSISKDRSIDYASVAPAEARRIFLDHALVRGEYKTTAKYQQKNNELLEEVASLRAKARKSDMLADDQALLAFFDERVGPEVVNGKTFEEWRSKAEKENPKILFLTVGDVLTGDETLEAADYPDFITLHGVKVPVTYTFDPSADDDGITLTVPLALLPQLDPGELDGTIPGWQLQKITALLWELPKSLRREIGDIPAVAAAVVKDLRPFAGALLPALAKAVHDATGADVRDTSFRADLLSSYLRVTLAVKDEHGKIVAKGKNIDPLLEQYGARARAAWQTTKAAPAHEKTGLTTWDIGELAPFIVRTVGGADIRSYPALVDRGKSVDLVLEASAPLALAATRAGIRRLLMLGARQTISAITPRLPNALSRADGAPLPRAETEAFRERLLVRIVDAAFALTEDAELPRNKASFDKLLAAGAPRLAGAFQLFVDALKPVSAELDRTLAALRAASKHPSGRAAVQDLYAQLAGLFPADLITSIPLARLAQVPRYLRAMQARLARAVTDPMKDAGKLDPFVKLHSAFSHKRAGARDAAAVDEVRWLFEELRVAIFAPELKTAVPVSLPKMTAAVAALR